MDRNKILEDLEELEDKSWEQGFIGSNERELFLRESIVDYIQVLLKVVKNAEMSKENKNLDEAESSALDIADIMASASFKNDLEKAIEMGESVGFNEDGGYEYFSQSDALEAVMNVLKKHFL